MHHVLYILCFHILVFPRVGASELSPMHRLRLHIVMMLLKNGRYKPDFQPAKLNIASEIKNPFK